jgi:hypothetical protein
MADLNAIEALAPTSELRSRYDAVVVTAGFESRSIHAAKSLDLIAERRIACAFAERHVGRFEENKRWLLSRDFVVSEVMESEVEDWATTLVDQVARGSTDREVLSICVDISSMTRFRLASILNAILQLKDWTVEVDFLYSVAKWSPPSNEGETILRAGAVSPVFAGWSVPTDTPIVAIIGLGYEPDKAVGAYEYLEATDVWAFLPDGEDIRYMEDLNRANRSLLSRLDVRKQVRYRVDQPVACFGILESIVYGLLSNSRPVLLPFGPKIFALCAMLVACLHRDVPVWRISSEQSGEPVEREASGKVIGMRTVFSKSLPEQPSEWETERTLKRRQRLNSKLRALGLPLL